MALVDGDTLVYLGGREWWARDGVRLFRRVVAEHWLESGRMAAMMSDGWNARRAVELTTRQWQVVDAAVDNEVNTRAEEGDERFVDVGLGVRQAGWDQVTGESRTWPPGAQVVTMTLSLEQWGLVVSSLNVLMSIQDDDNTGDDAATPGAIREMISTQVGARLPEWPMPHQNGE
jgi:hypothetical protein